MVSGVQAAKLIKVKIKNKMGNLFKLVYPFVEIWIIDKVDLAQPLASEAATHYN